MRSTPNSNRLSGKKALITGAGRGIGLGCARIMASLDCDVVISDIDAEAADAAASECSRHPALQLDVTRRTQWIEAVNKASDLMGGLNVLVNNAGIIIPGNVDSLGEADWDRTIDVDLKSVFLGCQAALPLLSAHPPSAIVNIASISSIIASGQFAAYNAAKGGVLMLTKSIALHAARNHPGVRCNSVHPAFVDTGMVEDVSGGLDPDAARNKLSRQVPLGRIATVEDVAWAVVYLASDESSFVTGAELKLDGGISAM
jgi:NAD(P)-dependent dehydrogenase (short-subunit alcohol dehydrogenase family)